MRLNKVWDERGGGSAFRERFSGKEAPSVREFISYLQEKGSPLDAPLVRREKPSFVAFTDFRVYEEQARKWMVWLGFEDAVLTPPGPDGGIDIVSDVAVAQVKLYASQIGIDKINEFAGASAPYPGRIMIYFAASGYTKSAVARADQAQSEIALFVLTQFDIEPVNEVAQNLYAYADRL
nr:restriction endonuclease [Brevibacterium luteolum]